ncbi:hypothetical protein OVS_02135 [Mycoplasma ovis str. Michigan]|uniref:Uncharacterized protein n=1 Tax=Mycoplasma ovis str. Michigan TaxID=1415773 RepID=A0ABM5P1H2_9MOLU|nr:hypothetical protein OVS_02135 [Mycoplasma ovis str. Michigan]
MYCFSIATLCSWVKGFWEASGFTPPEPCVLVPWIKDLASW